MTIEILERVPPGDRWRFIDDSKSQEVYNSLTDALNAAFETYGKTDFFIEARKGLVSTMVDDADTTIAKQKKYNIYGDS